MFHSPPKGHLKAFSHSLFANYHSWLPSEEIKQWKMDNTEIIGKIASIGSYDTDILI